jgi:hypothetical protein
MYFVLDDLGSKIGRTWREMGEGDTDGAAVIRHLIEGQYSNPVRIVAFNIAAGWSRDVTKDMARELQTRCSDLDHMPQALAEFLGVHGR